MIKQTIIFNKTASRTSVASIPFSVFDLAGNPGAGTLAVGNTANGIVYETAISKLQQNNNEEEDDNE